MGTQAGQIIEDEDFASISASSDEKPIGRVTASGTQSLTHNTYIGINMAIEEIDTHGFHSTTVNTSRVTPTVPGYYRFTGSVAHAGRTDYVFIETTIRVNGGTPIAPTTRDRVPLADAATTMCQIASAIVECDGVTDYVEVVGRQLNGASAAQVTAQSVHLSSSLEWEFLRGL